MIKYLGALVVVGGICLGSLTAHAAEITTGEFLAEYKSGSLAARKDWEETLAAVQQGMAVANVALVQRKDAPLYCSPPLDSLAGGQLADMLARKTVEIPSILKTSISVALFVTLQLDFPCPAK